MDLREINNSIRKKFIKINDLRIAKVIGNLAENIVDLKTLNKMKVLSTKLQLMGINDISTLGTLTISEVCIPKIGLLKPANNNENIFEDITIFRSGQRVLPETDPTLMDIAKFSIHTKPMVKFSGIGHYLKTKPFTDVNNDLINIQQEAFTLFSINESIWVANHIDIKDDSIIVLKDPLTTLIVIAEKITIGKRVSLTWEKPIQHKPPKPSKPKNPDQPCISSNFVGKDGEVGLPGILGNPGVIGMPGPTIELYTLNCTGKFESIDLSGQNGGEGGDGGDGGDGGKGANGRPWREDRFNWDELDDYFELFTVKCKKGPGYGGNGGKGGIAGKGGHGGEGGHGGRFRLYAPKSIIDSWEEEGFYIDVSSGKGGDGGIPGLPGKGGAPGQHGRDRCDDYPDEPQCCPPLPENLFEIYGEDGDPNTKGVDGMDGDFYEDAVQFHLINDLSFFKNSSMIRSLSKRNAMLGDTVDIIGINFKRNDVVLLSEQECITRFISSTSLKFIIPQVEGGRRKTVKVKQVDGQMSNSSAINIIPQLLDVEQQGNKFSENQSYLFSPGKTTTIYGNNFSSNPSICINDEYILPENCSDISTSSIKFKLIRPNSVSSEVEYDEKVKIRVIFQDGIESNSIEILLDTFNILVIGDSIMWGQGLIEEKKWHTLVTNHIRSLRNQISVNKFVKAHSGAIIGNNNVINLGPLHGEIPDKYPTIFQQIDSFSGVKDKIDIVFLDGGINDIGVPSIVNPLSSCDDIESKAEQYCYKDMKQLLIKTVQEFPKANIFVLGYYQIVSDDSDISNLIYLLVILGLARAGLIGGLTGYLISEVTKSEIVENCETFKKSSDEYLKKAVQEVSNEFDRRRIEFISPKFTSNNSIFASESMIWGIGDALQPADDTTYGVAYERCRECDSVPDSRSDFISDLICDRASIGHPNVDGAKKYADEIINRLKL